MKHFFVTLIFLTCSLSAQWPEKGKIKIIYPAGASSSELDLLNKMANFFAEGNTSLAEDMLIADDYAKRFFTYYTHDFLIIVGKNNQLLDVAKQGVKLSAPLSSFTEQGAFKGSLSYLGLTPNPLFLKARFLGAVRGVPGQSLVVYGDDRKALARAFEKIQEGYVQGTWGESSKDAPLKSTKEKGYLWGQAHESDYVRVKLKDGEGALLRRYQWKSGRFQMSIVDKVSLEVLK